MIAVERSGKEPGALTRSKAADRYRDDEVVEQLFEDFRGKCYICEVYPVNDPEVEHRLPHKGGRYPERKYDWNNLFYCCQHCNLVKSKAKYDAGIIDCCVRDPEKLLRQSLVEDRVIVDALSAKDEEARLTAELIEEVFMTDNPSLRKHAADARLSQLQLRMNALYGKLQEYAEGEDGAFAEQSIAAMLDRGAAFSGFTRCYVREHLCEYPNLEVHLA